MKVIPVSLKENSYKIMIGRHMLSHLGRTLRSLHVGKDAVIITHPVIDRWHGRKIVRALQNDGFQVKVFTVPEGEKSKSARTAFQLMGKIARYDVKRKLFIIALGGGVIGDLAGYVAAAYRRGIPYIQVPTTFLAQIDSAIGGKVAIDLPVGKNLVGAFYQPKLVWSDVAVLSTLSRRQMRNGLAEAVKYGVIRDRKLFDYLEKNHKKLLSYDLSALEQVVMRCSQIKANIVIADEKETKGLRTILNFGHTIGHAIETASHYSNFQHGEAVAMGMRVALEISQKLGYIHPSLSFTVVKLLSAIGLPTQIKGVKISSILRTMAHDKKFKAGKNRFVLATKIGQVKVAEGVPLEIVRQSILKGMKPFSVSL